MCRLPLYLLAVVFGTASLAAADSILLNVNNLGINGAVATANVTQLGANEVQVTITANSGYSLKVNGGSVFFNSGASLSAADITNLSIISNGVTYSGLSFNQMKDDQNVSQFGSFSYDFRNLKGGPHGVTSASQISFDITASGVTAQNFLNSTAKYQLGTHFCTAGGSNCGGQTGFAVGSGRSIASEPEPGTLSLVGTGLIGLISFVRRKLSA